MYCETKTNHIAVSLKVESHDLSIEKFIHMWNTNNAFNICNVNQNVMLSKNFKNSYLVHMLNF